MPDPFVACFCTIRFISDVPGVLPLAHKKLAFEKLQNTQRREEVSGLSPQDFCAGDGHFSGLLCTAHTNQSWWGNWPHSYRLLRVSSLYNTHLMSKCMISHHLGHPPHALSCLVQWSETPLKAFAPTLVSSSVAPANSPDQLMASYHTWNNSGDSQPSSQQMKSNGGPLSAEKRWQQRGPVRD